MDPKLQEALASDKPIDIDQGEQGGPGLPGGPVDPAAIGDMRGSGNEVLYWFEEHFACMPNT